mmetsp:Transcript_126187/g.356855  ORF Transcript_126187/g.356855 Transcript_126187/m.356855 type:complete len:210 (+) Transcript_126187:1351-1980(+)
MARAPPSPELASLAFAASISACFLSGAGGQPVCSASFCSSRRITRQHRCSWFLARTSRRSFCSVIRSHSSCALHTASPAAWKCEQSFSSRSRARTWSSESKASSLPRSGASCACPRYSALSAAVWCTTMTCSSRRICGSSAVFCRANWSRKRPAHSESRRSPSHGERSGYPERGSTSRRYPGRSTRKSDAMKITPALQSTGGVPVRPQR